MAAPRIVSVNIARAADLVVGGGRHVKSATAKRSVGGCAVAVLPLGLDGDEQADLSVHGGLSKAVYAYPIEHHDFWSHGARPGGGRGLGRARSSPVHSART